MRIHASRLIRLKCECCVWLMQQRSGRGDIIFFGFHPKLSVLPAAAPMLFFCCLNVQTPVQAVLRPGLSAITCVETPAGLNLVSDNLLAHTHTHKHMRWKQWNSWTDQCAEFQIYMKRKEGKLCCAFIQAFISNLNIFYLIYSYISQLFWTHFVGSFKEKVSWYSPFVTNIMWGYELKMSSAGEHRDSPVLIREV